MAPPKFPNGLNLYHIGFATLKYPELAPGLPVPLNNIIASQYLDTLMAQQTSRDVATLNDPASDQYYFSRPLLLLNFLTANPDVCKRIAAHPALVNELVEKMLAPDFHDNMKAAARPSLGGFPPEDFADAFGSVLQFLSTMLLYQDLMPAVNPRLKDLIPKLGEWEKTYKHSRVAVIRDASARLVSQINGMNPPLISMMRKMQEGTLCCGVVSCTLRGADKLTVCGVCKIQRYCGKEHQKADWKYHKHICAKGLVEPAA
ncbi:uncharacterized protein L3040_003184 [Drepanopeziza brunnea f. sp. 'multigermtubi']|uniref:uncharacterized protein n=1 Tax=Drepanopeziza brunnea f. sp. 'multigermtubi' TaxID=698441 RepID=UPI00239EC880|nr:hypothetical protein L3040_003184 [Drepanopeziza brunnea f. sp. 'multigermtubi']